LTRAETPPLDRRTRIDRMRVRAWALQVLYAWEAQSPRGSVVDAMDAVLRNRSVAPKRIPLLIKHLKAVADNLDTIDGAVRAASENWRLERLSSVDRSILRLSVAELLYLPETPPKVAIQEAIRLAGQYGGKDSPRFVNGVLDAIYATHVRGSSHA
jgi:N utilization substance protein B